MSFYFLEKTVTYIIGDIMTSVILSISIHIAHVRYTNFAEPLMSDRYLPRWRGWACSNGQALNWAPVNLAYMCSNLLMIIKYYQSTKQRTSFLTILSNEARFMLSIHIVVERVVMDLRNMNPGYSNALPPFLHPVTAIEFQGAKGVVRI